MDPPPRILAAPYLAAAKAPQKRVSSAGRSEALSGASPESSTTMPAVMKTWSTRSSSSNKGAGAGLVGHVEGDGAGFCAEQGLCGLEPIGGSAGYDDPRAFGFGGLRGRKPDTGAAAENYDGAVRQ
jgi:hypothetical protein